MNTIIAGSIMFWNGNYECRAFVRFAFYLERAFFIFILHFASYYVGELQFKMDLL